MRTQTSPSTFFLYHCQGDVPSILFLLARSLSNLSCIIPCTYQQNNTGQKVEKRLSCIYQDRCLFRLSIVKPLEILIISHIAVAVPAGEFVSCYYIYLYLWSYPLKRELVQKNWRGVGSKTVYGYMMCSPNKPFQYKSHSSRKNRI